MKNKSLINTILYIGIVICMFFPGAIEIEQHLINSSEDWGWSGRSMGSSSVSMLGAMGKIGGLNTVLIVILFVIAVFGAVSSLCESKDHAIVGENGCLYIAIAEAAVFAALWISIYCNDSSDFYWVYPSKYMDSWDVDSIFYLILVAVCAILGVSTINYIGEKKYWWL